MIIPIAIITAFLVTFILIPLVIKVSRSVDLMDIPDRRKVHRISTPSMGGIAVFIGWSVATIISVSIFDLVNYKFFLSGVLLIFILGLRDDISSLQARHKLSFQILAATLVVVFGNIRLSGLHGFLGFNDIPVVADSIISIFLIVGLTNAFNLIDGIDGLLGSISVLISAFLGWAFMELGQMALSIISLVFCGSLLAFLFFNWFPSKLFMGDTGSMICGFFISTLSIHFINLAGSDPYFKLNFFGAPIAVAVSFLIIPIYDTSRVTLIRLLKGISPFVPDRNHIHHALLRLEFNHAKATSLLLAVNIFVISITIGLSFFVNEWILILGQGLFMLVFGSVVDTLGKRRLFLGVTGKIHSSQNVFVSKSA